MFLLISCTGVTPMPSDTKPPSAKQLLYCALKSSSLSSPDLLFGSGDAEYAERFEALYHRTPSAAADGAVAISSGISADEITVIRPDNTVSSGEILSMLDDHVSEEISVYERYSPTDTENLKNALIYSEGDFVILIVSAERDAIRALLTSYIRSPESLPPMPDEAKPPVTSHGTEPSTDAPVTEPVTVTDEMTETDIPVVTETPPETEVPPVIEPACYPYAYENDLPEREPVTDDFFADAVFIGDSRLNDMMYYVKPECAGDFTYSALSVTAVFSKNLATMPDGRKLTIADALRETEFSKCYLMFGLNELGWPYPQIFINDYIKIINFVRSINPDCDIYVMTVYPVTHEYSDKHSDLSNSLIRERNDLIADMAKDQGVKLLNAAAAVCDENGELPAGTATDGVHGNKSICKRLYNYMRAHY